MADRTSARLFGQVFSVLAKNPEKYKEAAHEIFNEVQYYDFNEYQMDADEDLMSLGLARKGTDEEKAAEGYDNIVIYKNDSRF